MKNQSISKELLKRKLDKLDDWRTSIKCDVLPEIWQEFVRKLCGRNLNRFFENITQTPKRTRVFLSKDALLYDAKLHAEDQAKIERQTGPHIDWLIVRIESVWNDAPVVLRQEMEEARKTLNVEQVKSLLNEAVLKWSVSDVSDPMPESVEQARRLLFATIVSVIDVIEAGLNLALTSRPQRTDGKTTPEVRERIREIRQLHIAASRDELLRIVKDDPIIKRLGFGITLTLNQLQHAISTKSREQDSKN